MDIKSLEDLTENIKQTNEMVVQRTRDLIQSNQTCLCDCQRIGQETEFAKRLENIDNKIEENDVLLSSFKDMELQTRRHIDTLKTRNRDIDSQIEELKNKVLAAKSKKTEQKGVASSTRGETGNDTGGTPINDTGGTPTNDTGGTPPLHDRSPEMKPVPLSGGLPLRTVERNPETGIVKSDNREVAKVEPHRTITNPIRVHQREPRFCLDLSWSMYVSSEKPRLIEAGHFDIDAAQTVLCIDTSESMAENGSWEQTCIFVQDYLAGIEEMSREHDLTEERVALVTFGSCHSVLEHLTFDMQIIRNAFENLRLGGPSPLYGGLIIADAALSTKAYDADGIMVYPKVVVITDGKPTDTCLVAGPDTPTTSQSEQETKSKILNIVEEVSLSGMDLYCVPVGQGQEENEFLKLFVEMSDGVMLSHTDGRTLARRLLLTKEVAKEQPRGLLSFLPLRGFYFDPEQNMSCTRSDPDSAIKQTIVSRSRKQSKQRSDRFVKEAFRESNDPNLPQVGTRVRPGPDGRPGGMLDEGRPGTVTGHSSEPGNLVIHWDNTERYEKCSYGDKGIYHVVIVDEPRVVPDDTLMAVGCIVVPGRHWFPSPDLGPSRGICVGYESEIESARATKRVFDTFLLYRSVVRLTYRDLINIFGRVRWDDGSLPGTFSCASFNEKVKILRRDGSHPRHRRALGPPPAPQKLRRNKNLK